jgi:mycofactocin precursor
MPETELLERSTEDVTETAAAEADVTKTGEVVAADLLVEEISIDGMCGVY